MTRPNGCKYDVYIFIVMERKLNSTVTFIHIIYEIYTIVNTYIYKYICICIMFNINLSDTNITLNLEIERSEEL